MRIKRPFFILFMPMVIWVAYAALLPITAMAQSPSVAILPFAISPGQEAYIQQGIVDMLTSRLAATGQVAVIHSATGSSAAEKTPIPADTQAARAVGTRLGADYVLHGSVVILDQQVTLNAEMLTVADGQPALTYSRQNLAMGDIIPEINGMATQIVTQVFHLPPPTSAAPEVTPDNKASEETAIHAHPEKLLENINADPKEE